MPFISKLYHMLSHPEELQDVLVWDADGEAFIVHASDRLVQEVFPQVFGHGNFASFTRQLNVYSFCRLSPPELRTRLSITPSSAYSAWAHPLFTRDNNPDTLHLLAPRPNKARERSKREKREREREGERDDGRERSEKMKRRMAG
ncbi:heat shock factor family protein [Rhodotorula paludigena]|uniref:heat shock factor family protein n=1 Tax=Rhodotorula paludigena TaxID=86838 RepID=UPI00317D0EFA